MLESGDLPSRGHASRCQVPTDDPRLGNVTSLALTLEVHVPASNGLGIGRKQRCLSLGVGAARTSDRGAFIRATLTEERASRRNRTPAVWPAPCHHGGDGPVATAILPQAPGDDVCIVWTWPFAVPELPIRRGEAFTPGAEPDRRPGR